MDSLNHPIRLVVPNFTRGTVTSETSIKTTVVETIRQIDYTTGESYTVTGMNINIPSNPGPDTEIFNSNTQASRFSSLKPIWDLEFHRRLKLIGDNDC